MTDSGTTSPDATVATGQDRLHARSGVEVALLDRDGVIIAVNSAWEQFCRDNGGDPARVGVGISYLGVCALADADPSTREVAAAIRAAIAGDLPAPLAMVVDCDAPGVPRTFDVLISSRLDDGGACVGAVVTLSLTGSASARASKGLPGVARPAADLVDGVEDLFAVGLGIQSLLGQMRQPAQIERLKQLSRRLDAAIRAIRNATFAIETAPPALAVSPPPKRQTDPATAHSLRHRVMEVLDEVRPALGFGVHVEFRGPVDLVRAELADEVVAAVRDALWNTAYHAEASRIDVTVTLSSSRILVEVAADAQGQGDQVWAGGMAELRARAEKFGGTVALSTPAEGGIHLAWAAPTVSSPQSASARNEEPGTNARPAVSR